MLKQKKQIEKIVTCKACGEKLILDAGKPYIMKWTGLPNNCVRFKYRPKDSSAGSSDEATVLICRRELCSGMSILQPLTIHASIQIRPLVATRKLIQMYVLQAQSALLQSIGTEVFKLCQPLLFSSSNRSCTQVVTFLYGRRSLCSGKAPERTIKVTRESETCKTN